MVGVDAFAVGVVEEMEGRVVVELVAKGRRRRLWWLLCWWLQETRKKKKRNERERRRGVCI